MTQYLEPEMSSKIVPVAKQELVSTATALVGPSDLPRSKQVLQLWEATLTGFQEAVAGEEVVR